jgi:RNA polymerase sigma factor (sigma-70 family)
VESQEAFGALVDRHGPMVLGVCRHVLHTHHDAEDAFQATFLVLARKGGSIRNRRVLAGWLHEVAHRTAIKARARAARRRLLEREGAELAPAAVEPNSQDEAAAWNELRPVLHAEVEMLPERYRIPVILSYLEGKTNEEVAALLRWPVGTVKGRLSRARELLRRRLTRRGLTLSAAFLLTALSHGTVFAEVVPADLLRRTVRRAGRYGTWSAAVDRAGSENEGMLEPVLPDSAARPQREIFGRSKDGGRIVDRRIVGRRMLAIVAFLVASGIWVAVLSAARPTELKAAIAKLVPAQGVVAGGRCHE